jgi:hypothetical protein
MTAHDYDPLEVAVRAYAVAQEAIDGDKPTSRLGNRTKRRKPQLSLVFDTETTIDSSQRLNFGAWRLYSDRPGRVPGRFCVEEGLIYADDLPDRDPGGFAALQAYARCHDADVFGGRNPVLRLLSQADFVERILWRHGYRHRATIVGFNLPFDLSRLAVACAPARRRCAGGNSLRLFADERFRPRIAYRALDSKRALIGFTSFDDDDGGDDDDRRFRGHPLDMRTLSSSLADRGFSLESACEEFGVPYVKRRVTHGVVTEDTIAYCREDVQVLS